MTGVVWVKSIFDAAIWPHFEAGQGGEIAEPLSPEEFRTRYSEERGEMVAENFPRALVLSLSPDEKSVGRLFPRIEWEGDGGPVENIKLNRIPEFAHLGRYVVVSGRCRALLEQFEIGDTSFFPTKVLQSDGVEEVPGDWQIIHFGNVCEALDPDRSEMVREVGIGKWDSVGPPETDSLVFDEQNAAAFSIWRDPSFRNAVCVKDDVFSALQSAGLEGALAGAVRAKLA